MSGSASQLSVVGYQLSDGSATTTPNSQPSGSARNSSTRASGGAFGHVLSARMKGQAADGQDSPATARRANAPAETTSKDPGAVKLGDEKRIEDHTPAAASVAAQVLPAQCFVPTVQEDLHPSEGSLDGAYRTSDASGSPRTPALNSAGPQPPTSLVPASRPPTPETSGSASSVGKQDTAAVADPLDARSGLANEQTSFSASRFASSVAFASDQQTSAAVAAETARLEGVPAKAISPGTLRPDVEGRNLEHSSAKNASQESGGAADTSFGTSATGNAAGSAAEVVAKLQASPTQAKEAWLRHPGGDAVPDNNARFNRNSETTSQFGEIPTPTKEAAHPRAYAQTPDPITSTQPEMTAPQLTIGDSMARKTNDLTQPFRPIATRDEQQNANTSSGVALPVAGHAAAFGSPMRGDRSPIVSDAAASSPVENTPAAPAVIQSAQVLERMGKSEIRLGLNSSNFGNIELHTSVNQDRVGASIATSHAELRSAMIAEMPSLEHAIAQHQLRLDSFQFDSRSGSQAGDSSASNGNQSGSRSGTQSDSRISELTNDSAAQEVPLPPAWTASHSGLNVHA